MQFLLGIIVCRHQLSFESEVCNIEADGRLYKCMHGCYSSVLLL